MRIISSSFFTLTALPGNKKAEKGKERVGTT
jgi:hypothetical protein